MNCVLCCCFRPAEVEGDEYEEFYKAIAKDSQGPLSHIHFVAEGEVTFKSVLFIPKVQQSESFNKYGTRTDNIKVSFLNWIILSLKGIHTYIVLTWLFSCTFVESSSLTTSKTWCRTTWTSFAVSLILTIYPWTFPAKLSNSTNLSRWNL